MSTQNLREENGERVNESKKLQNLQKMYGEESCESSEQYDHATLRDKEVFFFDQCCARHNNCGSHETVLN